MASSTCGRPLIRANLLLKRGFLVSVESVERTAVTPSTCRTILFVHQKRQSHSRRHVSSTALNMPSETTPPVADRTMPSTTSMSCLPLSTLIRSYMITSISSIPVLLRPSLAVMSFLAHSKSRLFNPDSNPLLKMLMKKTFYVQFCAGESPLEVRQTIQGLKAMGYKGVILGHAREVVMSKEDQASLSAVVDPAVQAKQDAEEITVWKQSTMDTIQLAQKDDFVALKFTGAGRQALRHLSNTIPCSPAFEEAVHEICRLAQERGVSLLFDAEQASIQQGIDNWTLYFMRIYNKGSKALVYGTYQAYAKRTPNLLAQHLAEGQKDDFVVGVKLVRGAYLGSDPRELFWGTIEETHRCYNTLSECVLRMKYADLLQPTTSAKSFPRVNLVLASHNATSVARTRQLRNEQAQRGEDLIPLAYGQLMGMADNVSCELVQAAKESSTNTTGSKDVPQAYKYLVWGTLGECMKYLLRRAQENKDAVSRTIEARQALGKELARRVGWSR